MLESVSVILFCETFPIFEGIISHYSIETRANNRNNWLKFDIIITSIFAPGNYIQT